MSKKKHEAGETPRLLDKPRILYPEAGVLSQAVFYGVLLLLGGLGSLGCLFGAFPIPLRPAPVLAAGALCLLFCLTLFVGKRPSWILSLAGVGAWIGLIFLFFEDLVQGCAHTVNQILLAYGDRLGTSLPVLRTQTSLPTVVEHQCTVFCCLFLFPYLFFLSWFLVGRKSGFAAFCLTGLALLVPMTISLVPPWFYLATLLLFWLALLLLSPALGKRHRLLEDKKGFHASGSLSARPATLLLLPAAALCMVLTYWLFPLESYQRPQLATDLRQGLTQGFGLDAALEGGVGNGNGRVHLDTLGSRSYTGETVLRVRYDWESLSGIAFQAPTANREKDYLKSFVGSEYTGRSWERLPAQTWQTLEEQLHGVHPQTLLDRFRQLFYAETPQQYTLSVENLKANPRCLYLPYGLQEESVDLETMAYVEDGFWESTQFFSGTPSYTVAAWGLPEQSTLYPSRVTSAIYNGFLREKNISSLEEMQPEDAMELQRVLEWISIGVEDADGSPRSWRELELWTVPQEAMAYLTPEQQETARAVEAYNRFVYDQYTQLPQDLRATLEQYLEENVLYQPVTKNTVDMGSNSPLSIAQRIANTLAAQCSYTLSPPVLPEGRDFVEYFLLESRQGFCVHFATAATALLRAAGIPARYAEGYAVPSGQEGWVDIPDYNAHAWVEIYLGGTGWIPVEVTPAGPNAPAATQNALPGEVTATPSPSPTPAPTPSPTAEPTPAAETSPTPAQSATPTPAAGSGGTSSQGGGGEETSWLLAAGAVLLALLAAGAVLFLRRRLVLAARERQFAQADRNQAALALYAHLLALYREGQRFHAPWADQLPPSLEDLAQKARFSQHTLTEEEVRAFRLEVERVQSLLRDSLPGSRRLWDRLGSLLL